MKIINFVLIMILASTAVFAEPNSILTLDMAINMAIASNSLFLATEKQDKITGSLLYQAKQSPNPELKIGVDDYAGSGAYKNTSSMKSIIGITQTIEMGNKRKKRINSAKAFREQELLKIDIARKELKLSVIEEYIELLRNIKELDIQTEACKLADETSQMVNKKVSAGELAPIDATRACVEFAREETIKKHLELDVISGKNKLASLWNSETFDFEGIDLNCKPLADLDLARPTEELLKALPEMLLADSMVRVADTEYIKARSEANTDVDLSICYNKYRESSDHAWGIEASFPLKGKSESGNISAAKHSLEAAKLEKNGIVSDFSVKLANAFREKESLQIEVANIETNLLPAAKRAYKEINTAFENGEKSLLDLFDARKTMLETSKLYLDIYSRYLNAIAEYAVLSNQY